MPAVFRNAAYERTPKALTGAELKNCDKLATMHLAGVGDSRGAIPEATCFAPPLRESLSIDSQLLTTRQADGSARAQTVGWVRGGAMGEVLCEVRGEGR